jgi:ribose-phosphate pyrophosphokinase
MSTAAAGNAREVSVPVIVSGSANPALGAAVASALGTVQVPCKLQRFPDGELEVEVTSAVRGRDAFVVQPTVLPVGENLLELLLLADACERAGARTVTAVLPYFGYARQDRRRREGQPHAARVVANALQSLQFERLLAVDLHSAAIEGCLGRPVEHLTALPLLADAVKVHATDDSVIVAPDFGAAKLAEAYARRLGRPLCIVHKSRKSGTEVSVRGVVGDVRGKKPIVIDDLISTGGTIVAALDSLREAGCAEDITVVTTHGLLVGEALPRLGAARIARLYSTDSVLPPLKTPFPHTVVSIAPLLANAIGRLRDGKSLGDLLNDR